MADYRSSPTHGLFESFYTVVAGTPRVEEDQSPRLPRRLQLPDHQFIALGSRGPVHPPQVIARLVLAERVEVLAASMAEFRLRGVHRWIQPAQNGQTGQLFNRGVDDQAIRLPNQLAAVGQA